MRRALAAMAGVAVLAACAGGGGTSTGAATSPAPTSPAPTRSTPAPASTVAPPTAVALIPQETPDLAATALFAAWRKGDHSAALVVAIPAAVTALFMLPAQDFSDRGCQVPLDGTATCAFAIGGEAAIAQIHTVSLAGGWVVQSVAVTGNT